MIEKVNPSHPDKIADRIAGAIVDLAYAAEASVNIYAFLKAQETGRPVQLACAIGDDTVDGRPYAEIVETAKKYILSIGGFEKFAEWGLF